MDKKLLNTFIVALISSNVTMAQDIEFKEINGFIYYDDSNTVYGVDKNTLAEKNDHIVISGLIGKGKNSQELKKSSIKYDVGVHKDVCKSGKGKYNVMWYDVSEGNPYRQLEYIGGKKHVEEASWFDLVSRNLCKIVNGERYGFSMDK